jgi:hypothetical protein
LAAAAAPQWGEKDDGTMLMLILMLMLMLMVVVALVSLKGINR